MQELQTEIKVNGAIWVVINKASWSIKRYGRIARLVWHTATSGKIIIRDVKTGRYRSQPFVA